jgi:hypothetical protein
VNQLNTEEIDRAIQALEARIKLHRATDITLSEVLKRRELYEALHKLRAVRTGIVATTALQLPPAA